MFMSMFLLYLSSFYLVFGFDEWFVVWLGLELNMISFLMLGFKSDDLLLAESMGSYFFVQSLGSGLLLGMMYVGWSDVVWVLLLSMKMGAGPFYYWYISVMSGFKWVMNFILMVFQSVMLFLMMSEVISVVVGFIGAVSMMIGVFGVFNQTSLSAIFGFSSVYHTGWMMCIMMDSVRVWWLYLIVYGFMMYGVISMVSKMGLVDFATSVGSLYSSILFLVVLNLGGIPPMVGFVLKWMSFYVLWEYDYLVILVMILLSTVMLYVYMRLMYEVVLGGNNVLSWGVGVLGKMWFEVMACLGIFLLFLVV